jgi:hypothetical protein
MATLTGSSRPAPNASRASANSRSPAYPSSSDPLKLRLLVKLQYAEPWH